ncbi:MAG: GTPase ObgE [Firmicutes bacterium HGW-Firmicutes-12]|nr:MAG: GTPase ObgE [Firmicutes bacterium HGW-Firmicutes-12]
MFYDYARIYVKGGDGGNGMVAFRREKYVPDGGPSGGDGGKGGDVVFKADEGLRTLVDFRYKRHYKADKGEHGRSKGMNGARGDDLLVRVPVGTVIKNAESKEIIADLISHEQEYAVAKGGRGGRGNTRFATSNNKAPEFAENGDPGEDRWLEMELKLLADVGLLGFPNVGKSTIISRVSAAKPKIANYHFTTIDPNLGVVRMEEGKSFVLVDIPGLVEGASEGIGLGHRFLRHVERTRLLLHVLDIAGSEGRDPCEDFVVINNELEQYNPGLKTRKQIIVANKMDIPGANDNLKKLREEFGNSYEIYPVSAVTGDGLRELMYRTAAMLEEIPVTLTPVEEEELRVVKVEIEENYFVNNIDGVWEITGPMIERMLIKTNLGNEAAVKRFLLILRKMGLDKTLRQKGAKDGDTVRIGKLEFDFMD